MRWSKDNLDATLDQLSRDGLSWLKTGRRPVFHGTAARFAERIREEGIRPATDGIFVTRSWKVARWYALQRSAHAHITHGHEWAGVVLELDVDPKFLKRTPPPDNPDDDEEELRLTAPCSPAAIVATEVFEWTYEGELAVVLDEWLRFDNPRCQLCTPPADRAALSPLKSVNGLATLPGPRPSPAAEELLLAVAPHATSFTLGSVQHGPPHWRRVAIHGERLAQEVPGVDLELVRLFSVLHDSQRRTDNDDPEHGPRAARLARELNGEAFPRLTEDRLRTLEFACARHSDRQITPDPTVGCCWDSDRLDLWRVASEPKPGLMSTDVARRPETIRRAWTLCERPTPLEQIERRLHEIDPRRRDVIRRVGPSERLLDLL